ncbi:MAG: leucine-rich repeat protein [Hespellia sp.]|nr:leucine-rich repeat protein [Hespellia sp.]
MKRVKRMISIAVILSMIIPQQVFATEEVDLPATAEQGVTTSELSQSNEGRDDQSSNIDQSEFLDSASGITYRILSEANGENRGTVSVVQIQELREETNDQYSEFIIPEEIEHNGCIYQVVEIEQNVLEANTIIIGLVIPDCVITIAEDAFLDRLPEIICNSGSYAEEYAKNHNIPYMIDAISINIDEEIVVGREIQINKQVKNILIDEQYVWSVNNSDIVSISETGTILFANSGQAVVQLCIAGMRADVVVECTPQISEVQQEDTLIVASKANASSDSAEAIVTEGSCGNGTKWQFFSNGQLIIYGDGKIDGYPKYGDAGTQPWYAKRAEIKEIVIEDGITEIGFYDFYNCFNLETIRIPESVKAIDSSVFDRCLKLTQINIDERNQYYCSEDAIIYNKDKTLLVRYSEGKTEKSFDIPFSVTGLSGNAFKNCLCLENIDISKRILSLNTSSFEGTKYEGNIGKCGKCVVWRIYENGQMEIYGDGKIDGYPKYGDAGTQPWYAKRAEIKKIVIEDGITEIGFYDFYNCFNLKTIRIPESVKAIDSSAFDECLKVVFEGYVDSYAQTYANNNNIPFVDLESVTSKVKIPEDVWQSVNVGCTIDLQFYEQFFDDAKAKKFYTQNASGKGLCFGWAQTAAMLNDGSVSASSFGSEKVSEIEADSLSNSLLYANEPISALDWMKYVFLFQYSKEYATEINSNKTSILKNNYDKFVQNIKDSVDTEKYCCISIRNNGDGHALIPIAYEEQPDQLKINVYDCNYPDSTERYLYIHKTNNKYDAWEYDVGNVTTEIWSSKDIWTGSLSFIQCSNTIIAWLLDGGVVTLPNDTATFSDEVSDNTRLVTTKQDEFGVTVGNQEVEVQYENSSNSECVLPILIDSFIPGQDTEQDGDNLFWVEASDVLYTAKTDDVFSVTDSKDSIEFTIPSETRVEVSKETEDGKNVSIEGAETKEITVKYSEKIDGENVEYSITGIPAEQVEISTKNQEVEMKGFNSGKITAVTGDNSVEEEFEVNSEDIITIKQSDGNESLITIPQKYMKGDVNDDTDVNLKDLMIILKHVSGKEMMNDSKQQIADVNADGKVDLKDLMLILKFVSGKITEL